MSNLLEKIKRDIRSVWEQLKAKQQEINWKQVVEKENLWTLCPEVRETMREYLLYWLFFPP